MERRFWITEDPAFFSLPTPSQAANAGEHHRCHSASAPRGSWGHDLAPADAKEEHASRVHGWWLGRKLFYSPGLWPSSQLPFPRNGRYVDSSRCMYGDRLIISALRIPWYIPRQLAGRANWLIGLAFVNVAWSLFCSTPKYEEGSFLVGILLSCWSLSVPPSTPSFAKNIRRV